MRIREELEIDFEIHGRIKELVDRLEEIYKEAIILNEKDKKRVELEDEFYNLSATLEVVARAWARAGKISWDEFDVLNFRYTI